MTPNLRYPMRVTSLALLGVLAALPAAAQQSDRTPERSRVRMYVNGDDVTDRFQLLTQRRARLGITVNLEAKETDSLGALVTSVTPGGPASKAGIRSGDIITKLDGKSVLAPSDRKVDAEESAPGVRLIEMAAKLEPNVSLDVEFLRGDARRTVKLTTGDEPVLALDGGRFVFPTPGGAMSERLQVPGFKVEPMEPGRVFEFRGEPRAGAVLAMGFGMGALRDLELAPLNADLGSYFGTTEGVLVIRAPSTGSLNLKSGDVILSVDGRKATNPGSLLRILRSYNNEETFKLEVLRQKQRQTLTGRLGSDRDDEN